MAINSAPSLSHQPKGLSINYLPNPSCSNGSTFPYAYAMVPVHDSGSFVLQSLRVNNQSFSRHVSTAYRFTTRGGFIDEEEEDDQSLTIDNLNFQQAVVLFNNREYYACHDALETLWNNSNDPLRTLYHGILQCAVGLHHLFNQNHLGAMMELGEGVCKLRKLNFKSGPFNQFEEEISAVLDFIYQTQVELAACTDEVCVTMDRSERSYQLLGGFAAGQRIYYLDSDKEKNVYIYFRPNQTANNNQKIKIPLLHASEDHLIELL